MSQKLSILKTPTNKTTREEPLSCVLGHKAQKAKTTEPGVWLKPGSIETPDL